MNTSGKRAFIQILLITTACALVLIGLGILARGQAARTLEHYHSLALEEMSNGLRVLGSHDVRHPQISTIHRIENGDSVYEMSGNVLFTEIRILVRLNNSGIFQDYKIIFIHNPLRGWEFGNSFAYYELSSIENSTMRIRRWSEYIQALIQTAEEYHS
ncbi:MAG: hypothetical protein ACR2PY_02215 [Salinispira sp.]